MWEPMTIDEYAALETTLGATVTKVEGVWWRKTRPFFYQPLFPFAEIIPMAKRPPRTFLVGGYQHLVPEASEANSRRNFFVWDDVRAYSLDSVGHHRRNSIKKGMKHFILKPIDDERHFIAEGHPVYCSFYERSRYSYKKGRRNREKFAEWASALFRFPKVKILGAYHEAELSAIDISYLVEDVLIAATFFSRTDKLKYRVADFMAHAVREKAAECPGIAFIFKGSVSGVNGIDEFKQSRGCTMMSKPAFYWINPLARTIVRTCMRTSYNKLVGTHGAVPGGGQP